MKNTLYQILGVEPKASMQEIEAGYNARIEELKFATLQDPNKLRILQQSKEILTDANRRAAYDASLSVRVAPTQHAMQQEDEPETTFLQQWGKWFAAGGAVIIVGIWWANHGTTTPPQKLPPPKAITQALEPSAPAAAPESEPAAPVAAPTNVAPVAVAVAPANESAASPVMGEWSCADAITGRNSKYNFQQNGALSITASDGQVLDYKYELDGVALKITDPKQTSTFAIEELVARKMILNTGAGGQRVVCTR
jgi:hypothetical protein